MSTRVWIAIAVLAGALMIALRARDSERARERRFVVEIGPGQRVGGTGRTVGELGTGITAREVFTL